MVKTLSALFLVANAEFNSSALPEIVDVGGSNEIDVEKTDDLFKEHMEALKEQITECTPDGEPDFEILLPKDDLMKRDLMSERRYIYYTSSDQDLQRAYIMGALDKFSASHFLMTQQPTLKNDVISWFTKFFLPQHHEFKLRVVHAFKQLRSSVLEEEKVTKKDWIGYSNKTAAGEDIHEVYVNKLNDTKMGEGLTHEQAQDRFFKKVLPCQDIPELELLLENFEKRIKSYASVLNELLDVNATIPKI